MSLVERLMLTTAHNLFILGIAFGSIAIMSRFVLPYLVSRGMVIPVVEMDVSRD